MRNLEHWLKAYVRHQEHSEAPTKFHFWTGVATIAGALRRRVWIDMLSFQWTPNFYIILVGPPGVAKKSTTLRQGLALLSQVKGIKFGPQSSTWQALLEAMVESFEAVQVAGMPKPQTMSCVTIAVSELGNFLRPDNREFLDFLVEMWEGQKGDFVRRTKMSGEAELRNPWLNLIGCTTPAWLKDNMDEILWGGGLASRIIFVYADRKRKLVAYPSLHVAGADYERDESRLLTDLRLISSLKGRYELTPDAINWGTQWYETHHTKARPTHLAGERFSGYLERKQTHIHKLAMVLAAAQRNELRIDSADLIEAEAHVTDLERDMVNVFASIGISPAAKINNEVLTLIIHAGAITYRQLYRLVFATTSGLDFKNAVQAAVNAGYVRMSEIVDGEGKKDHLLTALMSRPNGHDVARPPPDNPPKSSVQPES